MFDSTPSSTNIFAISANKPQLPTSVPPLPRGEEEFPGRPEVIIEPFSSAELANLHKRGCILCLERDGQDYTQPLSAEQVVEEIVRRAAPDLAQDARPPLKKLLSGRGALRPKFDLYEELI